MMSEENQNDRELKEMLGKLLSSEEAKQTFSNVKAGEKILGRYAAPEPDDKLISDIKVEIAGALAQRKTIAFRQTVYRVAAIAAVFIVVAVVSVKVFEKNQGRGERLIAASMLPKAVWESDDITGDDANLATLAAEIEQIEQELAAVQLGGNGGNGPGAIMEIEQELIEINSSFWEG